MRVGIAIALLLVALFSGSQASAALIVAPIGGGPAIFGIGESLDFEVRFDDETLCCVTLSLGLTGVPGFADVVRADTTDSSFTSTDAAFLGGANPRINYVGSVTVGGVANPKVGEFELFGIALGEVVITLLPGAEVLDASEMPVGVSLAPVSVLVTPEPGTFVLSAAGLTALALTRRRFRHVGA